MKNPLETLEPGMRLRLLMAKIRNVCYYKSIDDRPRAQYMHVFRSLRADVLFVLNSLPPEIKERWENELVTILRIIPPKIKTHDCAQVANNLSTYVEKFMNINWSASTYE